MPGQEGRVNLSPRQRKRMQSAAKFNEGHQVIIYHCLEVFCDIIVLYPEVLYTL